MLKKVQFEGQPGPQRRADAQQGSEELQERGSAQLRVDSRFQISNPTPNHCVGAEQLPCEKRRVRRPEVLAVILGLPAQPWVGCTLELLVAEQTSFQRAEDAGAKPLKVLIETPALQVLDCLGRERRVLDHRREPVSPPVIAVCVFGVHVLQQAILDDPLVKRCARNRAIDQELSQGRLEFHQPIQFLRHDLGVLVIKSDNHRGQNGDAVLAKFRDDFLDWPALLLGITGARSFVPDPKAVNPHLQNLLDGVLAQGFDAGECENRERFPALLHTVAELPRSLLVEQEILVDDEQDQLRVQVKVTLGDGVDVLALGQQPDVLALEEVRGAAKIAAIRAAQPSKDLARGRDLPPKYLEPAYQQRLLVRHRDFRLAQEPAKEPHAFLSTEVIAVGLERLVLEHRPVAAQDNLAVRRVAADQRDSLLHLVHDRQQEGDANVIVALLQFADQLALRRILQHYCRGVKVLRDVFEGVMDVDRPRAEEALGARHLPVKEFIANRRRVAIFRPQWAADAG